MSTATTASNTALELAGFVLAHAAWSISDLPAGDLLCPLAGIKRGTAREFQRFEADSQHEAITLAWETLGDLSAGYSAWAFAHEGLLPDGAGKIDALILHVWEPGLDAPLVFAQKFVPFASGRFRLLDAPIVRQGGRLLNGTDAQPLLHALQRGIEQHDEVAPLWPLWLAGND